MDTQDHLTPTFFEAAFNLMPIGCYMLSPTPEATILAVNDAFLKNVGRERDDMVGKGLFEVFPGDPNDLGDTGEAALRASIAQAIQTGQPAVMPVQRYPIEKTLPNGVTIYEERFWNAFNTPLLGEDGRVRCVFHATIEVTEQVRAQQALKDQQRTAVEFAHRANADRRRLNAVLEATPVGLVVTDARGGIVNANSAHKRLWGEDSPETRSVSDYEEYHGWWVDGERRGQMLVAHEWPAARALKGETSLGELIEIASFNAVPARRICSLSAAPVLNDAGEIIGAVLAQLDVTEQIRAEDTLRQSDRRKDEFLAMLAHELRNPLAPIGAAADLLSMNGLNSDRLQQISGIITRQVAHMTSLVNDLLDVSRVTRGLVTLEKDTIDAKQIVALAVEQVRPLIEARKHHFVLHLPPESAYVQGDAKRLVQALTNVLSNAAKYTPDGGKIMLDVKIDRSHVRIDVQDNGIGMDAGLLDRAFELFVQGQRTADRTQGGLGIGLALVRSLMELHGGSVHAHSDGVGKGSRFILCLPHIEHAEGKSDGDATGQSHAMAGAAVRVMIVDDNQDAARTLSMIVASAGHQVSVEYSPRKALERARQERPQALLLDIGMPEMDGYELARQLRAQPETAGAVLIAVTGYGQEQDRKMAQQSGFDHFFTKPVDTKRLTGVLHALSMKLG